MGEDVLMTSVRLGEFTCPPKQSLAWRLFRLFMLGCILAAVVALWQGGVGGVVKSLRGSRDGDYHAVETHAAEPTFHDAFNYKVTFWDGEPVVTRVKKRVKD